MTVILPRHGCIACGGGAVAQFQAEVNPIDRISGPHRGYFICASAERAGLRFIGHARISIDRPTAGVDPNVVREVQSVGTYMTREKAIQAAESQARFVIDGLQPSWAPFTAPGALI